MSSPVPLILSRESRRRVPTTCCRTTPEYYILLVLPGNLHVIRRLASQINGIPSVRILRRRLVVIMTRNPNVRVAFRLRRREDRIQHRNSPPVGEEMSLLVMLRRVLAKVILVINALGKPQSIIQRFNRVPSIDIFGFDGAKVVDDMWSLFRRLDGREMLAGF